MKKIDINKKLNWKPIQEQKNWPNYLIRLIFVLLAAFIYYLAVQWFILGNDNQRHTNFLSTGISGILLTITSIFPTTTNFYFLMQLVINIPLLIYSFFSLGKITTLYTVIFIGIQYAYSFIPDPFIFGPPPVGAYTAGDYALQIISGIFAGIIGAIGASVNYINGSTAGGTDVAVFNINLRKKIAIGRLNIIFNTIIIAVGFLLIIVVGIIKTGNITKPNYSLVLFDFFGTIIYVISFGVALDYIYPKGKKIATFVIIPTSAKDEFNTLLQEHKFYRTFTEIPAKGGRKKEDKVVLLTVLTAIEYPQFKAIAKFTCKEAFIFSTKINDLEGNFSNFKFD